MSLEIIRKTKKLFNKQYKEWGEPVPYPELEEEYNQHRLDEFKKQFGHLEYEAMPTKEDLAEIRTKRYAQ